MDSPSADAAQSTHTYYLYRDAHGTAHMADRASEVPANARQLQKVTVGGKAAQKSAPGVAQWLPSAFKIDLAHKPASLPILGAAVVLLFFFIRSSAFRSLILKVTLPLLILALGLGGFFALRHPHGGAALPHNLGDMQHSADAMGESLHQQDRVLQQMDASEGPTK